MQRFSGLWLVVLVQVCMESSAAPPTTPINTSAGLDLLSNSTTLASTSLSALPPDPYQIRVYGTHTSLILAGFGPALEKVDVLDVLLQGQSDVIEGLVASKGNAPIERLAFLYWSGERKLYLKIQPVEGQVMKWLMLAQMLEGILQFMEIYGYHLVRRFTALDDEAGIVGTGTLSYYRPSAVGVNASSPVATS